jgi:hypothetical protein
MRGHGLASKYRSDGTLAHSPRKRHIHNEVMACQARNLHQFAMQPFQRPLGVGVFDHGVGVLQFLLHRRLVLFWQMIYDRLARLGQLANLEQLVPVRDWRSNDALGPRTFVREELQVKET